MDNNTLSVLTTESEVLNAACQFLSVHGIFHYRNNTGAYKIKDRFIRYGFPGSSDIAGVCPDGRALYVECKKPGKKPSPRQREFLDRVNGLGAVGIVADSVLSLEKQLKERGVIRG
ncbi:MAG: VRR-NUC domain-containing protein [Treponema sp.]|jgi:hypothetical protein|nr:VRR-NUC domain-containing protein [Treponema sp.]